MNSDSQRYVVTVNCGCGKLRCSPDVYGPYTAAYADEIVDLIVKQATAYGGDYPLVNIVKMRNKKDIGKNEFD